MSTSIRQRRAPLGLFADRPIPWLDGRIVEVLPVHNDVRPTLRDAHALNRGGRGARSPADGLVGAGPDERSAGAAYDARNGVTAKHPTATI
jgi:hypothetical protein